ncbi:hypothetical protein MLD38_014640 [Melastoma candidum]|uniref:Uncharacterized protein n=1 Tax=Melastoma candidum TaxID=119954 RepID=A0ACB9RH56_9MYRT|nr:hypothetical protein MLD38_014640 [Melastoma candidum]
MEIGADSSNGGKASKKSRSVDLKSIYEPKSSKKNDRVSGSECKSLKRKGGLELGGEGEKSGRKRCKKELPLSFLKTNGKNVKKSLVEVYNEEISVGSENAKNVSSDEKNVSKPTVHYDADDGASGNSMPLGLEGGTVRIPKKRRGFVGRKKHEVRQSLKSSVLCDSKSDFCDEEVKPSKADSGMEINGANCMEKEAEKSDEKMISLKNPDRNDGVADAVPDKDAVDSLPKKSRKKRRKKGMEQVGAITNEGSEPLLGSSTKMKDKSVEEDEKNLEENAAMMLSLRFDPSCTGFSANNKGSASPTTSRSLFQAQNSGNSDSAAGSEFVSPDMAERVLRPRSRHGSKSLSRKRRHFYEVHPEQFSGVGLLNKRIKIFWPLDESWYRGLVNNYDHERKLYHIKYDDRDEEWVDLHNEKFKLLLFPSEFPGRSSRRRRRRRRRRSTEESHEGKADGKNQIEGRKKKLATDDENSASNNMDTMPIISWVTRTKSSSSRAGKKQKTSVSSMHSIASLMTDDARRPERRINDVTEKRSASKSQKDPVVSKGHSPGKGKISPSTTSLKEKKNSLSFKEDRLPIVYFRRHRKTSETLHRHDRVGSFAVRAEKTERDRSCSISLRKSDFKLSFQMLQDILSKLTIPIQPEFFSLKLYVPVISLLNYYSGAQNIQFSQTLILLQQGSLMMTWPKVRLDVLLADNLSGLRFLLFEGSLEEALSFCLLLLQALDHRNGADNDEEEPLPVLSVNLRRLSLSECLNGNVSVLEDWTSKLPTQFVCGCLIKGLHCLKEPGLSRQSCCDAVIHLFSKFEIGGWKLPTLAFPDATVPNISKSVVIKLLMDSFYSDIFVKERGVQDTSENTGDTSSVRYLPDAQQTGHGPEHNLSVSEASFDVATRTCGGTDHASPNVRPCNPDSDMPKQINECEKNSVEPDKYYRQLPQPGRFLNASHSFCNGTIGVKKLVRTYDEEMNGITNSTDLNAAMVPDHNPTAPRSVQLRRKTNSSYRRLSSMGSDDRNDSSFKIGFMSGPKKPRTQVSYLMPYGSFDLSPKSRNSHNRIASHKRIRRLKEKDVSDTSKKDFDVLSCDANVLITQGDRGWRETGATVYLEIDNQNEWKLVVKNAGTMQYSYKAHQFLQPGSTNRFTHAMIWKGGKDWVLEFTNRSQWTLFKEMHEECYNRNVRAASAKTIPIPGVRVIDENEDSGTEELLTRTSSKYFQQVESDVEMALNPSRVLYDMDTEDELWISVNCSSDSETCRSREIMEELFERTMDAFEKAAYSRQSDQFSSNEIEELMVGVGPIEIVKSIHDYWWKKRQRKGMPLIRHLQPPSWERYQQQVKDWESTGNKLSSALSSECQKVSAAEKPPMFAFCMKPRGLEVPNKGSKQRSRRKFSVAGTTGFPDHDGFHSLGRRSSGNSFGSGKVFHYGNRSEFLGDSMSPRWGSPRDVASPRYLPLGNDGYYNSRFSRNKSKRIGALISPRDSISYSQRDAGWKNGMKHWSSEWSDHRNYYLGGSEGSHMKQLPSVVADDYVIRDASGTAQHAQKIARLKREKAERMFHRADRAVHKALAALMAAEAIKAALEDRNLSGLVGSSSGAEKKEGISSKQVDIRADFHGQRSPSSGDVLHGGKILMAKKTDFFIITLYIQSPFSVGRVAHIAASVFYTGLRGGGSSSGGVGGSCLVGSFRSRGVLPMRNSIRQLIGGLMDLTYDADIFIGG